MMASSNQSNWGGDYMLKNLKGGLQLRWFYKEDRGVSVRDSTRIVVVP